MLLNLTALTLFLFYGIPYASATPGQPIEASDPVHAVVVILRLLHASSFCSSFAPQPTSTFTKTYVVSATTTSTSTTTSVVIDSETASTTATSTHSTTTTLPLTEVSTITQTKLITATSITTKTSTSTVQTTATVNVIQGAARLARRGGPKPSALKAFADNIISSACSSYQPAPSTTKTLTSTSTSTLPATTTDTSTLTTVVTTLTSITTVDVLITEFSTTTVATTTSTSTTLSTTATQSITITTTIPVATVTHTYAVATKGTGCGDIVYYDFLQASVVTQDQCLNYCNADPNCKSIFLQCSPQEPCECLKNAGVFNPSDLQCNLPTDFYGPFTWWNKIS
ncbi:hypothetical protein BCR34DRAFT_247767 [Clohesyomyces aquaticus]|uniref:Apple domain-containing protein n=1 Tax=Clohesyomyces aquaticus TaxID=1231657 RepID=A0A1Y1Y4L6_9PLEO|nr:hypothetical protein BCR34DRAFT_247767 [Clohesyomyces aquaticus]